MALIVSIGFLSTPQPAGAEEVTLSAATAVTKEVGVPTNIWGTATGAPNRAVHVQVLVNGAWSTSQSGTTNSTGFYALPLTYGLNTLGTFWYRTVVPTSSGWTTSPTVTLTRTPRAVTVSAATAGTKEVGLATNMWGTATGAPNRPVYVQVLVNGNWSTSRSGTTSSTGFYALPLTYGANSLGTFSYRAVVLAASGWVTSPAVTLTRIPRLVTVSAATAGTKEVGVPTNIWGTANGAPNRPVFVQVNVNGAWPTSQTGTTSSTGFYALPLTYGSNTPGTYSYRAVVHTASGYVVSPTVTLTRTQRTVSQTQAMRAAEDYLEFMPFSRLGLIDQLEYEGYSNAEAQYAVDNIRVDWREQAVREAKGYLEYSAFSESGLVDQLLYEQYTLEQAQYGVQRSGADWMEQAHLSAVEYLEYMPFSRSALIDQLKYEGFTQVQAEYGADSVGL